MAFHLKWRKCFKQEKRREEKRRGGENSIDCERKFLRGHVATAYLTSPLETIAAFLFGYMCMLSHFSNVRLCETLWTVAHQVPLSMGFSRQEYWSGLLYPPPGDLPNSQIASTSPALQVDSLPTEPPGKPINRLYTNIKWKVKKKEWSLLCSLKLPTFVWWNPHLNHPIFSELVNLLPMLWVMREMGSSCY